MRCRLSYDTRRLCLLSTTLMRLMFSRHNAVFCVLITFVFRVVQAGSSFAQSIVLLLSAPGTILQSSSRYLVISFFVCPPVAELQQCEQRQAKSNGKGGPMSGPWLATSHTRDRRRFAAIRHTPSYHARRDLEYINKAWIEVAIFCTSIDGEIRCLPISSYRRQISIPSHEEVAACGGVGLWGLLLRNLQVEPTHTTIREHDVRRSTHGRAKEERAIALTRE